MPLPLSTSWAASPGGLQPFTVDGRPMRMVHTFTGAAAQVWVTPQQQIIIAYQGTTGGTHLLFNPLIAISQLIADNRVILTRGTPRAFIDSLAFAQQVAAAAALQGYDTERHLRHGALAGRLGGRIRRAADRLGRDRIRESRPQHHGAGQWRQLGLRQRRNLRRPGGVPGHRSARVAAVHARVRARRRKQAALRLDRHDRRPERHESAAQFVVAVGHQSRRIDHLPGRLPGQLLRAPPTRHPGTTTWASPRIPVWCRGWGPPWVR